MKENGYTILITVMSDIQEEIDILEGPVAEPHPEPTEKMKRRKKPMNKEYMREYYHRTKETLVCEHCERIYGCRSSLVKHQNRSVKCNIERIKGIWQSIKSPIWQMNTNVEVDKCILELDQMLTLTVSIKNISLIHY